MTSLYDDLRLDVPVKLGVLSLSGRVALSDLRPGQPAPAGFALGLAPPAWIVPEGAGPEVAAGIWRDADVAAWRRFTTARATEGLPVSLPLWHGGRLAHPLAQPGGGAPVAPSAVPAEGGLDTWAGWRPFPVPRALRDEEIPAIARCYAAAARRARAAGFDAVEVHAGAGGLLHQFLDPSSNRRAAPFGGSAEDRARLPRDVVLAVADAIGTGRLGLVLDCPYAIGDQSTLPAALALLRALQPVEIAWLRLEAAASPARDVLQTIATLRDAFRGPLILGPAAGADEAGLLLRDNGATAVTLRADALRASPSPHPSARGVALNL